MASSTRRAVSGVCTMRC